MSQAQCEETRNQSNNNKNIILLLLTVIDRSKENFLYQQLLRLIKKKISLIDKYNSYWQRKQFFEHLPLFLVKKK